MAMNQNQRLDFDVDILKDLKKNYFEEEKEKNKKSRRGKNQKDKSNSKSPACHNDSQKRKRKFSFDSEDSQFELPVGERQKKCELKDNQFLKQYLNKNGIHDGDREKASSIV